MSTCERCGCSMCSCCEHGVPPGGCALCANAEIDDLRERVEALEAWKSEVLAAIRRALRGPTL